MNTIVVCLIIYLAGVVITYSRIKKRFVENPKSLPPIPPGMNEEMVALVTSLMWPLMIIIVLFVLTENNDQL